MDFPESDCQILKLTTDFYAAYPSRLYKELLEKRQRAYNCLLFQTHYDYFICIPYRSEVRHDYAYHFKTTARSKVHKSGLDYSKIVIIKNTEYIDSVDAIIDKDEFNETMMHLEQIKKEALENRKEMLQSNYEYYRDYEKDLKTVTFNVDEILGFDTERHSSQQREELLP